MSVESELHRCDHKRWHRPTVPLSRLEPPTAHAVKRSVVKPLDSLEGLCVGNGPFRVDKQPDLDRSLDPAIEGILRVVGPELGKRARREVICSCASVTPEKAENGWVEPLGGCGQELPPQDPLKARRAVEKRQD
jgi:hypothetical protein